MAMQTSVYGHHRLFLEKEMAGVSPYNSHSERTNDCYACESNNFDSNMVMVLAALLCSLLCALGLSSIVRCALRCRHRFSSNNPSSSSSIQVANPRPDQEIERSAEKKAWISIPETKYESGLNLALTDCPICLGDFTEGDKVRVLPICNHGFHVRCIDKWLLSHPSCPLCRQTLLDQPSTPPRSANSDARELQIRVRIPGLPEILAGR